MRPDGGAGERRGAAVPSKREPELGGGRGGRRTALPPQPARAEGEAHCDARGGAAGEGQGLGAGGARPAEGIAAPRWRARA